MNKTITFFKSKLHEGTDIVTVTISDMDGRNKSVFYCPLRVVHEIVSCNLQFMALYDFEFEINKNAVIIHYPHLLDPQPDERPIGCVVKYYDYYIHASVFNHKFYVGDFHKLWMPFNTLKDAKNFIHSLVNKNRKLF